MNNPIKALREGKNFTRNSFSRLIKTSYQQVAAVELGYPRALPRTWRERLQEAGFDFERLDQEYRSWRSENAASTEGA